MSWLRQLLRPIAHLAGRHARRQLRAFCDAHNDTAVTQQRLLEQLLTAHAETAFGREHGFDRVRTYDDFRAAVPVGSYETHLPYMRRVLAGEPTALLPPGDEPLMFAMTSGTTGEPKYVPVTRRFLEQIRSGWNAFGVKVLGDHPSGWLRPILQISSSMRETTTERGVPCGAVSGLLAATQKRIVRFMYVTPPGTGDIRDPAAKYYTILRCGAMRDVGVITTANPSSVIKLFETGQTHLDRFVRDVADGTFTPPGEVRPSLRDRLRFRPRPNIARRIEKGVARDGELRATHLWQLSVLTHWTGGTLGLYLPRVRQLCGNVPIRDIGLLASEGRFSIPLADETPAGVAEILGNFLEFIPAEQRSSDRPDTLRAHELDVGQEYFLVFSNATGLWRYNLDDRVRVVDRYGNSPVFAFLSRGLHTANITGEKITEHQVVEAMRRVLAGESGEGTACADGLERFRLQGRFADVPYYELRVERDDPAERARLAAALDAQLATLNVEYEAKRHSGRLGPIRPVGLPAGTFDRAEAEAIRARRGRGEQYKHRYLETEIAADSAERD